jgi:UDP-2,3-diacylglucosamine pyrophosphatase LpxH
MPTVQLLSDLHLHRTPFFPPDAGADLFVLPGDVSGDMVTSIAYVAEIAQRYGKPVVFVPGNHEYYGGNMAERLLFGHQMAKQYGVHLLHNRMVEVAGLLVHGTTLWTDFDVYGESSKSVALRITEATLNDFNYIYHRNEPLTAEMTIRFHAKALRVLEARLIALEAQQALTGVAPKPVLVASHHAPAPQSIAPQYASSLVTAGFVSDLSALILRYPQIKTWVHGHTHTRFSYQVGQTSVACNPRGYGLEVPDFRPDLVIDIPS